MAGEMRQDPGYMGALSLPSTIRAVSGLHASQISPLKKIFLKKGFLGLQDENVESHCSEASQILVSTRSTWTAC